MDGFAADVPSNCYHIVLVYAISEHDVICITACNYDEYKQNYCFQHFGIILFILIMDNYICWWKGFLSSGLSEL